YHTYESVKHDFNNWLPKTSAQGVVLFHDICVKDGDFGVWKLWEELRARYPHFEFSHGHGLGVLAVGDSIPEKLGEFFEAAPEERALLRDFFHRIGERLSLTIQKEHQAKTLAWHVEDKERIIQSSAGQVSVVARQCDQIQAEIQAELAARARQTDSVSDALRQSEGSRLRLSHEIETLAPQIRQMEMEKLSLQRELLVRTADLERIKRSFAWRLLSRYGRIKYRYLLPIYRLLRLLPPEPEQSASSNGLG